MQPFLDLGNYNQTIENNSRSIEIKPEFAGAYYNIGVSDVMLGNSDWAVDILTRAAIVSDERMASENAEFASYRKARKDHWDAIVQRMDSWTGVRHTMNVWRRYIDSWCRPVNGCWNWAAVGAICWLSSGP